MFADMYAAGISEVACPSRILGYLICEDSDNLVAKLPGIAALIYNMKYQNGKLQPNRIQKWIGVLISLI